MMIRLSARRTGIGEAGSGLLPSKFPGRRTYPCFAVVLILLPRHIRVDETGARGTRQRLFALAVGIRVGIRTHPRIFANRPPRGRVYVRSFQP